MWEALSYESVAETVTHWWATLTNPSHGDIVLRVNGAAHRVAAGRAGIFRWRRLSGGGTFRKIF